MQQRGQVGGDDDGGCGGGADEGGGPQGAAVGRAPEAEPGEVEECGREQGELVVHDEAEGAVGGGEGEVVDAAGVAVGRILSFRANGGLTIRCVIPVNAGIHATRLMQIPRYARNDRRAANSHMARTASTEKSRTAGWYCAMRDRPEREAVGGQQQTGPYAPRARRSEPAEHAGAQPGQRQHAAHAHEREGQAVRGLVRGVERAVDGERDGDLAGTFGVLGQRVVLSFHGARGLAQEHDLVGVELVVAEAGQAQERGDDQQQQGPVPRMRVAAGGHGRRAQVGPRGEGERADAVDGQQQCTRDCAGDVVDEQRAGDEPAEARDPARAGAARARRRPAAANAGPAAGRAATSPGREWRRGRARRASAANECGERKEGYARGGRGEPDRRVRMGDGRCRLHHASIRKKDEG